jgi:hypothetical protein
VDDRTHETVAVFRGHGAFDVSGTDADDDWLTLDLRDAAGCPPLPEIRFDGGVGGDDGLSVIGGGAEDLRYEVDPRVPGTGRIAVGGAGVAFTNLEPVDVSGLGSFSLTLPGANDVITIANGFDFATGTLPAVVISGTSGGAAFESVAVRNVTSVNVNTASVVDGNDTVTVTGAGNAHGNT